MSYLSHFTLQGSLSAFQLGFYSCLKGLFGTTFYILGCKEICVDSVILKFGRSATELPHLVEVPCFVFQNIEGGKVQTQFCQTLNFESTFLKSPSLHSNEKFRGPSGVSAPWFYFITWKPQTFPILSEKFWAPFGQNLSFSSQRKHINKKTPYKRRKEICEIFVDFQSKRRISPKFQYKDRL